QDGLAGVGEQEQETVACVVYLASVVSRYRFARHMVVILEKIEPCPITKLLDEWGGFLDIGEEDRYDVGLLPPRGKGEPLTSQGECGPHRGPARRHWLVEHGRQVTHE